MYRILIILIAFPLLCLSQNKNKFFVLDADTKKPIPYATINFINSESGTYCDENGIFYLISNNSDSLNVSSIGYHSSRFIISTLKDSIFLNPKTEVLNEVVITNKNKEIEIGIHKKASNFSWYIDPQHEFITYLKFNERFKNGIIDKIHIPIKKSITNINSNIKAIIRTNIYLSENGFISKKIFTSKPVYYDIKNSGMLTFDISNQLINLNLTELYIGIEVIAFVDFNGKYLDDLKGALRLPFTNRKSKEFESKTYLKFVFSKQSKLMPLEDVISKYVGLKKEYYLPIGFSVSFYED